MIYLVQNNFCKIPTNCICRFVLKKQEECQTEFLYVERQDLFYLFTLFTIPKEVGVKKYFFVR